MKNNPAGLKTDQNSTMVDAYYGFISEKNSPACLYIETTERVCNIYIFKGL